MRVSLTLEQRRMLIEALADRADKIMESLTYSMGEIPDLLSLGISLTGNRGRRKHPTYQAGYKCVIDYRSNEVITDPGAYLRSFIEKPKAIASLPLYRDTEVNPTFR